MYTLVVVDMQSGFSVAHENKVQNNCIKAIKKAMKDKAAVVYLEYGGQGETFPCLTDLTKNYKKAHAISKWDWDGSQEALEVIKKRRLAGKRLKVCGVYTQCCVYATVQGLVESVPDCKIDVISDACWSTDDKDHKYGLNKMNSYKNVKLV